MWWGWGIAGIAALLLAGTVYVQWRKRQRKRSRLISFVALLTEPVFFDPAILASVAGKVWDADLGDGASEGDDGFVASVGPMNTVVHGERMFLINSFHRTYIDNLEETAEKITDLRIRGLFLRHQAWFSCDAMGVDYSTDEASVSQWYQRLGRLFAELLDERCLLIFLPDLSQAFPINDDTEAALRADDPIRALQETITVPLIEVKEDDPVMLRAVKTAREEWPTFLAAFESRAGENFTVKAPVTRDEITEFIWIIVSSIEGDRIYGTLGNDPANLGPLKLGSKVSVAIEDLNDWGFMNPNGEFVGGFTIEAIRRASSRPRS